MDGSDRNGPVSPGVQLRRYRDAARLTQRELADRAGVSVGAVRDLEQGRTRRPRALAALAEALMLSPAQAAELVQAVSSRGLRLQVLGPLKAWQDGTAVTPHGPRQRAVLGLLALQPGSLVHREAIIDVLWPEHPPDDAMKLVQVHVSRLRRALVPDRAHGADDRLLTSAGASYQLHAGPGQLDLLAFGQLAAAARAAGSGGDYQTACDRYRQALGLWQGEPLADVDLLHGHPAVTGLARRRVETSLEYARAASAAGWHDQVLALLADLAGREPLNERVQAQLMIALAGCGQQTAALTIYHDMRRRLDDELGMPPGPDLTEAHQLVLRQDMPRARGAAPATGDPVPVPVVPRELPAAVGHFVGRGDELATLTRLLEQADGSQAGTIVISAIGGMAGVGKTALALHWAHQVAGRFPDGQLYVNLRGFGPVSAPADPAEAIRVFLEALGARPERIPANLDSQAALYRSLLAGKRVLIVLDNARDASQVRPLLPASPGCLVIATSRASLASLAAVEAARLVNLDVLTAAEARELLTRRLGTERAAADPAAVDQIAGLCASLPLALVVAAARAAARPRFPLAALADELADSAGRLDALDAGDPTASVRAVFSWSVRQLTGEAARIFRLLGIHPGPDITVPAAASLAGIAEAHARRLLRELASMHLIAEHIPGRYAFHDLLRAYAAEQSRHTDSDTDQGEATGRLLDHYLHTAARATSLINPSTEPVVLAPPRPGAAAGRPADRWQALAWFEAERHNLLAALTLAAGSGFDNHAWQLPWTMADFLQARGHWQEWNATQHTALAAASRLDDTAGQALCGRLLGNSCIYLGDHDQARRHYISSLMLYQRLGNHLGQAKIQQSLGMAAGRQGRHADALEHAEQALSLYSAIGDKVNEGIALNSVGWYHCLLGDYQQARVFCRQAITVCAETGSRRPEGNAWDSLGYVEHHLGDVAEAIACYGRALSLLRESGDRFDEATTLTHLGDAHHAATEPTQARDAWRQALTILDDLHHPDAGQVRAKLSQGDRGDSRDPAARK